MEFLVLIFLFLLLIAILSKARKPDPRLPPGPRKLPIIGSMHRLVGTTQIHHKLRDLAAEHGPVMHLKAGQVDLVVISSPQAVTEVTKTHDLSFASRPEIAASKIILYGSTDVAFSPYGDYWRHLRKLCTLEVLSAARVRSFARIREDEIRRVVDEVSLAGGSPVNLSEVFASFTNSVSCRAISSGRMDRRKFVSTMEEVSKLASGFAVADLFPSLRFVDAVIGVERRLRRCHRKVDGMIGEIIEEHQMRMANKDESSMHVEDLVDVLLRIKDGEEEASLTIDNVKAVIVDMFTAGTDTSSSTLTWAMAELVRKPETMAKAQQEIRKAMKGKAKILEERDIDELRYLKLVVKETLRLHPPLPLLLPRLCGETCQVGGFTVPSGTRVVINAWALGRDPGHWDDAESFRPERFDGSSADYRGDANSAYLPFGAGRRVCPGATFALAVVELALANLLYHFEWELPDGMKPEDLDMTERFGMIVRKMQDLRLHATLVNHMVCSRAINC